MSGINHSFNFIRLKKVDDFETEIIGLCMSFVHGYHYISVILKESF
jgi:hypothetical protein